MTDSQEQTADRTNDSAHINKPGVYVDLIRQKIRQAGRLLPHDRILASQTPTSLFPEWYVKARKIDRNELRELSGRRWMFQRDVDDLTRELQDIKTFAEPLLTRALKDQLGVELDVRVAELRLYVPSRIIFGIDRGADHFKQMTLLDAALHNFEAAEAEVGAFSDGSGVFTQNDDGSPLRHSMTVEQFVSLCRTLDLGAKYQLHIKGVLSPAAASARVALQQETIARDKEAFKQAALIALLKGEISTYGYDKLLQVHDGVPGKTFYGLPLQTHRLSLMGFRLHGITLFSAVGEPGWAKKTVDGMATPLLKMVLDGAQTLPFLPHQDLERFKLLTAFFANGPKGLSEALARNKDNYQQSRLVGHVIAYIPDDPDHPLREYDSFTDFMKTLISQLRRTDYQQYFSRFVAQQDKGIFFRRVNERLKTFTWQQREPLNMGPWWRETAVENPNPEPITHVISANLWSTLYNERRDKAIADARKIAVPTGDEDAQSRWKRLTGYLDIAWNLFNFTAMLVPGLGEAMLAVMVVQLLDELAEGVEDWSKGDREEAAGHLCSVLINGAQLAMMGAGHVLPSGRAMPIKSSTFVDNLKVVELPDGTSSLWNPDLKPYERRSPLADNARPDARGLYRHEGRPVLALRNKLYNVKEDLLSGQHRIEHPGRSTAYQPELSHNGAGAWVSELETPLTWDEDTVWNRLGHSIEGFSVERQAQIRTVSGIDHAQLRRMHVEHERPPGMLIDTLNRFRAFAEVEQLGRQILDNRVPESLQGFVPTLLTELPGWPESRALELFDGDAATGSSIKYGNPDASAAQTINVSLSHLRDGELMEQVLDGLSEDEAIGMLGRGVSSVRAERLKVFRERLASHTQGQLRRLCDSLYQIGNATDDVRQLLLQRDFPQLPAPLARDLLDQASHEQLQFIDQKGRLPLQLKTQIRHALHELRVARAYEGLYLDGLASVDSERLALHSMAALPGWSASVRIEVRELSFSGALRDSVGPETAAIRKVLVATEDGRFEARDALDQHLRGADDVYASILHALPDQERRALGFNISQGAQLKAVVQRRPLGRTLFSVVLEDAPVRKPAYDPQTMKLRGGMRPYRYFPEEENLRLRVRSLYPGFEAVDVDRLLEVLNRRNLNMERYISGLEREFSDLCRALRQWRDGRNGVWRLTPAGVAQWQARDQFCTLLRRCWQRTGPQGVEVQGLANPQALFLDRLPLDLHLADFPTLEANFDHVTRLSMRATNVFSGQMRFLQSFRRLRMLDLSNNLLTELPTQITGMPYLTDLALGGNHIALMPESVTRLRSMSRLRSLSLAGNPLGLLPDITQMRDLQVLILENTQIETWPRGLFRQPRPRNIYLDMRNNPINEVPRVAPGSVEAELLARTHLSRRQPPMSADAIQRIREYTESVGLDPDRLHPPLGTVDSVHWTHGMGDEQWRQLQPIWDELEDEFGSESFFSLLRDLTETSDFKSASAYRAALTDKVWRMLKAMHENSALRESLFAEATVPTNCRDGAIQAFNELGIQVLVHEAKSLGNPGLMEAELVELAKGKSRIEQINTIARRHVSERLEAGEQIRMVNDDGNVQGSIDVVEVHLAFLVELANRLDLPWQARSMLFRNIAGVTPKMIDDAYETVIALEQGDLLRDSINGVPFWKDYIEAANRRDFRALRQRYNHTIAFKVALDERAESLDLSPAAKAKLKEELRVLAFELGKPESAIAPGAIMTDTDYVAELAEIEQQIDQLRNTLTQQAMDRAKVQRVEIPFTVNVESR